VLKQADEVVMVDLTPRALLNRLERGVVYPPERARAALQNFFRESTLVALRELAMRQAAYTVEARRPEEDGPGRAPAPSDQERQERLLLLIGPDPASAALIRRGRRVADYLRGDCLAAYVSGGPGDRQLSEADRQSLERHVNFARGLLIETHVLTGSDVAEAVVDFARSHGVTQIFLTRQKERVIGSWLGQGLVQRIVTLARDMQVTIVADRSVARRAA
jgi:two-component system sensor histidine kinase KdpD